MKLRASSSFTLIEMLTVMAVIAILASLIVSVNAFAHKKAALVRTEGEIKAMIAACEGYKADFGDYPSGGAEDSAGQSATVAVCPVLDGNPADVKYQKGCLVLYKALSGDTEATGKGKEKRYCEFRPDQLHKDAGGQIQYIRDPFGNSYGYSTNGAASEELYRERLQRSPQAIRAKSGGFNPTFDLWSTGGVISAKTGAELNEDRKRWVKNW